jgi:hypothetical protein
LSFVLCHLYLSIPQNVQKFLTNCARKPERLPRHVCLLERRTCNLQPNHLPLRSGYFRTISVQRGETTMGNAIHNFLNMSKRSSDHTSHLASPHLKQARIAAAFRPKWFSDRSLEVSHERLGDIGNRSESPSKDSKQRGCILFVIQPWKTTKSLLVDFNSWRESRRTSS